MIISGKRVVNATKRVVITITPADVKKGATKSPTTCAAALACKRDLGCTQARVHISTTYLEMGKKWVRYRTPSALRDEIISFDRGAGFHPGAFQLRPLSISHRATGKRLGGPNKSTRAKEKFKRAPYHVTTGIRPNPRMAT